MTEEFAEHYKINGRVAFAVAGTKALPAKTNVAAYAKTRKRKQTGTTVEEIRVRPTNFGTKCPVRYES